MATACPSGKVMSSPNIVRDTPQQHIVEHSPNTNSCKRMELTLNRNIDELKSTFEKMMRPHKAQYEYPRPSPTALQRVPDSPANAAQAAAAATGTAGGIMGSTMDMPSRMRAIKVFNVLLARLWRRRCAEVCDLHELVRKYQIKANTMREGLFVRNKMICQEQRRYECLESELRQVRSAAELSSRHCATIEKALNAARGQKEKLRQQLLAKTQECNNFAELLNVTKTDMFRELAKFRECAQELAEQQRQNRILEMRNAELEDELLTLKDRFQTQHDDIVLAVHMKQEKLDEAYETLKGYEQELAELELKHTELLKESRNDAKLKEIGKVERKIGMARYGICFIGAHRWRQHLPNFRYITYEIFAIFVDYMLHGLISTPTLPTVTIYLAVMLLIRALC